MKKEVLINLTSVQTVDSESSKTELITSGSIKPVEGGFEITYEESEATGFEGSKTILTCIGNERASIVRKGKSYSNLIIEKDHKHHCHYGTPFGEFTVGIFAHEINNELTPNGGKLYLKYTVDINSSYISDNEIYLTI
ncbi:MAG: DUF1934 domain-containing protein [Oscillospiraceae bacterium]